MLHPEPEDSRVVSIRLPTTLVQRLDRLLEAVLKSASG